MIYNNRTGSIIMEHQDLFSIVLSLILFRIGDVESVYYNTYRSYRFVYGNYYDYGYYRYHSYYRYYNNRNYGHLTSSEEGALAGGAIGGLLGILIFTSLILYCCYYKNRRTRGTIITTTTNPIAGTTTVQPATFGTNGVSYNTKDAHTTINEPPPPYEQTVNDTNNVRGEEDIGFENVDTRMKTNLVDNEVVPQ